MFVAIVLFRFDVKLAAGEGGKKQKFPVLDVSIRKCQCNPPLSNLAMAMSYICCEMILLRCFSVAQLANVHLQALGGIFAPLPGDDVVLEIKPN